jgi:hypothetical protein
MRIAIISNPSSEHQSGAAIAMAAGLKRHGIDVVHYDPHTLPHEPIVVCWGWRKGWALRAAGREILVMERGYVGDRFRWTSLGWNGLNGRATGPKSSDPTRWRRLFARHMRAWRFGGEYILVMGQAPGDMSIQGVDFAAWARDVMQRLREQSHLPVYFRPHPVRTFGPGVDPEPLMNGDLSDALSRAAAVVTWNSNSGVDAVLAGVPTVAVDAGSMAYAVAGHTLDRLNKRPSRSAWAHALAWRQWSLDEISAGAAWEMVGKCMC